MTSVVEVRHDSARPNGSRVVLRRWWLWLTLPMAALGIATSTAGIAVDRIYADETASWAAQAVGQDVANLVVLVVSLVLAYVAARGSARALLAWAGTAAYTAYTFAIYAFAVHFGPLFLAYVAVLGLSSWALIGFFGSIDPRGVQAHFTTDRLAGLASTLLIVISGGFALLWLSQDLPAMVSGTPSTELRDTGLLSNPVHVLDLALFLPAALTAGILLHRHRRWGYVLAPVVLAAMSGISLGIVSLTVVNMVRDLDAAPAVAVVIGILGAAQAIVCARFLSNLPRSTDASSLLHRREDPS
jgi:hypothetical protein